MQPEKCDHRTVTLSCVSAYWGPTLLVTPQTNPEYVAFSNLIIDDILLADGQSFINTLGGAGTHTVFGMLWWCNSAGFMAAVGEDLSHSHRNTLAAAGVDLRGLISRPNMPTPRAWQLFDDDERRVEVFRTSLEEFGQQKPVFSEMPSDYIQARGVHIQWGNPSEQADLIANLRSQNNKVLVSCEPAMTHHENNLAENTQVLKVVDLYSPDRTEAYAITRDTRPRQMVDIILGEGAPVVALRMGAAGSLVGTSNGDFFKVPAVPPAALVDVTGAGNAYCGGFLVGLGLGEPVEQAAARAAVSASFAIEQIGPPQINAAKRDEASQRIQWALNRIQAINCSDN